VKNAALGRELNPLGRGDGYYYCNGGNPVRQGNVTISRAKPRWVDGHVRTGFGNSVNNQGVGGGAGCPKQYDDNRCDCIDCFECPSGMPYWWHEAKDCCELIAATCIRWDPDTEDPTHACLWHWEFKPGCIYNAKQYDEVCPLGPDGGGCERECIYYGQDQGDSRDKALPPPQRRRSRSPGRVPPPHGTTYPRCNTQQEENIEWAITMMCGASKFGDCIKKRAPGLAECIRDFCTGDRVPRIRCGTTHATLGGISLKVPDSVDCGSDPYNWECNQLINSLWHELVHWCGRHWRPSWPECATERVVAGCTMECGTGVGIGAGNVQGCPATCLAQKRDCVDELKDLPCRTECGDRITTGGGGGW